MVNNSDKRVIEFLLISFFILELPIIYFHYKFMSSLDSYFDISFTDKNEFNVKFNKQRDLKKDLLDSNKENFIENELLFHTNNDFNLESEITECQYNNQFMSNLKVNKLEESIITEQSNSKNEIEKLFEKSPKSKEFETDYKPINSNEEGMDIEYKKISKTTSEYFPNKNIFSIILFWRISKHYKKSK